MEICIYLLRFFVSYNFLDTGIKKMPLGALFLVRLFKFFSVQRERLLKSAFVAVISRFAGVCSTQDITCSYRLFIVFKSGGIRGKEKKYEV